MNCQSVLTAQSNFLTTSTQPNCRDKNSEDIAMKIILELDRDEAHELNALIAFGYKAEESCSSGGASRDAASAVSTWSKAYVEAMQNDEG